MENHKNQSIDTTKQPPERIHLDCSETGHGYCRTATSRSRVDVSYKGILTREPVGNLSYANHHASTRYT